MIVEQAVKVPFGEQNTVFYNRFTKVHKYLTDC
jgi:hypothetical protein